MPIEPSRCSDVVGCGAPSVARRRSLETKRCINKKKEESQSDAQSHQGEAVACFYVADWFRLFFLFADVVISRTKTKQKEHKKSLNLDFWHCIGRGKSWSLKSTRRARGVTCFVIYFFPCSASIRSVRQKKNQFSRMNVPRFLLIGILKYRWFVLYFRASTRTAVYTPQSSLLSFECVRDDKGTLHDSFLRNFLKAQIPLKCNPATSFGWRLD